ncbi:MAG: tetratricopeptide repeat protein [Candidatus Levybacteria bacterium]|nr:tetratricopeptide repeat protein [Candidatus Levybacteria bacterium]
MTLLKDKAIQAMLLGDWKNATLLNKSLLNENPNDIDALNRLAYIFTILGRIKDAKSTYKKVLKLDVLNQIASRNIKKLTDLDPEKISNNEYPLKFVNQVFLEETGKTKIISLVNIAQPKVIAFLTTGQPLTISIKRSKIFVQDQNKQYLGVLPDDIGNRLIKLIKGGNTYITCIKSTNPHNVSVFIKEVKRASRYKDQPSFLETPDKDLTITKSKKRSKNSKELRDDEDDSSYSSEDEVS